MKKILVLLASALALTSCVANIGSNQPDVKKGEGTKTGSSSGVVAEDELVQGTLKNNEVLYVYYSNRVYSFRTYNNNYASTDYSFSEINYIYNRKQSDVIVDCADEYLTKYNYHWFGNASISIFTDGRYASESNK